MRMYILSSLLLLSTGLVAQDSEPLANETKKEAMTLEQEGSYLIGVQLGNQAAQAKDQLGLDPELLMQGLSDSLNGKKLKVDPQARWQVVIQALQAKAKEKAKNAAAVNKEKSKAYMEGLRGKEGFIFTDSGIAYEILMDAKGARPTATSTVKVHYRGTTIDGKEFDSSYKRGNPTSFGLNQVIKGWTEGIQLMPVGGKFRFHIPSHLAYGENAPASIGPNQALIFEVELLDITK